MRGRKPDKFELKPKDKAYLRELLRDGQIARRAQILLNRASNQQRVAPLGKQVGRHASTLWRGCERYRQSGLSAALYDATRAGRPPVFFQRRTPAD